MSTEPTQKTTRDNRDTRAEITNIFRTPREREYMNDRVDEYEDLLARVTALELEVAGLGTKTPPKSPTPKTGAAKGSK